MPPEEKKQTHAMPVIVAYTKAVKKYPILLVLVFVSSTILEAASIISPLYLRNLIDTLSQGVHTPGVVSILLATLLIFCGVILIRWVANLIQGIAITYIELRVMTDLTNDAFVYLLGHSHDFFISNFAGSLTRRVSRYSRSFEQIFDTLFFSFFSTALFAIGTIVVLFQRNTLLGSVLLVWTVFFLVLQILLTRWKHPLRIARALEDTHMTGALSDAVSNQSTISQFAANRYEESIFGATVQKWYLATLRSWKADTWIQGVQGFLTVVVQAGLLYGAIILWQRGLVTVGDFVLIQIYVIGLIDRIWNVGSNLRRLYDSFADAYEMVEIMERPHSVQDVPGATPLVVQSGEIAVRDVIFGFKDSDPILSDLSFTIDAGEKIALVGPSGAGKSTITKLLLRLYDVTLGAIEIDGQNIAEVTQESLRASIAFVPQEPILFHRSLMDNIRYGRQSATDEEVMEAAKKAHCHDFIIKLPEGYSTHVGERGVKLSGGERQRVAIARAILKNAPILILDEATSSLDSESESLIQDALKVLMEGKTVIVIAHRLSTIMTMDRIVVIEDGHIAAEGTHNELLDQAGGLYHKLWSIQAGSFVADASA